MLLSNCFENLIRFLYYLHLFTHEIRYQLPQMNQPLFEISLFLNELNGKLNNIIKNL